MSPRCPQRSRSRPMRSKDVIRKCTNHEARPGPSKAVRPRRPRHRSTSLSCSHWCSRRVGLTAWWLRQTGLDSTGRLGSTTPTERANPAGAGQSPIHEELPLSTRVHELAKELGLKSQELLDRIQRWGLDVKASALASLDPAMVDRIKQLMRNPTAAPAAPAAATPSPRSSPSEAIAISSKATAPARPSIPPAPAPSAPAATPPTTEPAGASAPDVVPAPP